jgi:dolichol-phosphate mannosyltransferase
MSGGLSVIVPVFGRMEPLDALYQEYAPALRDLEEPVEFLFVLQPENAARGAVLEPLRQQGEPIRILRLAQPAGAAQLTKAGATHARFDRLLVLPAYRRVVPESLSGLLARLDAGADAAFAMRPATGESLSRRLHRWLFHRLARPVSKGMFTDLGSGVGALRREALLATPAYGDFFRFIPALMMREGFQVTEVATPRHPADTGRLFHTPGVYLRSVVDLLGMFFLARFTERPLRFFGLVGLLLAVPGLVILVVLLVERLNGVGIANRPALLVGTLLLALGIQAIALGLVAEIIVHLSAPTRRSYRLARDPGTDPGHGEPG